MLGGGGGNDSESSSLHVAAKQQQAAAALSSPRSLATVMMSPRTSQCLDESTRFNYSSVRRQLIWVSDRQTNSLVSFSNNSPARSFLSLQECHLIGIFSEDDPSG